MQFNIRPATIEDVPAIQEVGRSAWRQTYTTLVSADYVEQGIEQWWSPDRLVAQINHAQMICLVAEEEGIVGGIATLGFHEPPEAYLWKLYLHPNVQGRGVGAMLLDAAIPLLPETILSVTADIVAGNERAGRFYLRYGFVHAGESEIRAFGHSVPLVRFRLALA